MKFIPDFWLEQGDIKRCFKDTSVYNKEWLTVYKRRDSYVEHFFASYVPVPAQKLTKAMNEPALGGISNYSRAVIAEVRIKHTNYLGLPFRRALKLTLRGGAYFAGNTLIAERKTQEMEFIKEDAITVRRDAVLEFLRDTKQVLLWCAESHRYSERKPEELNFDTKPDWVKRDGCNYIFEQMKLNEDQQEERPRMLSMNQIYGKKVIRLESNRANSNGSV